MGFPKVYMAVDSDRKANIVIDFSENVGGSVAFTINEDAALALRDKLDTYLNVRMQDFKEFWNANRKKELREERISFVGLVEKFEDLAESGEMFLVWFEKQDGSVRFMRAFITGDRVQYSYRTRSKYLDVVDADLRDAGEPQPERKIIVNRVIELIYNGTRYVTGR